MIELSAQIYFLKIFVNLEEKHTCRKEEGQRFPVLWFTSQMPAVFGAGQAEVTSLKLSQGRLPGQKSQHVTHHLLLVRAGLSRRVDEPEDGSQTL